MVSTPSKIDPQCAQHLLDPRFGSVFDLCAAMAEHPGPVGTGTGGRSDRDAGGRFFNFAVTPEKILDPPPLLQAPGRFAGAVAIAPVTDFWWLARSRQRPPGPDAYSKGALQDGGTDHCVVRPSGKYVPCGAVFAPVVGLGFHNKYKRMSC